MLPGPRLVVLALPFCLPGCRHAATGCDVLAADPEDKNRKSSGVADQAIAADQVIRQCGLEADGERATPQLQFELGRAHWAGKQTTRRSMLS